MTRLSPDHPTHECAKGGKPNDGELPQLLPLRVPLNTYHFKSTTSELTTLELDQDEDEKS